MILGIGKGFPGENMSTTPLPCDAWLDIYKETEDPKGGSTGIGLDFVTEIRLTPESFKARPAGLNTYTFSGTPEGIRLAINNNNILHVVYSKAVPGIGTQTVGYKGLKIDTNSYFELILKRFQFPKPTNQ